MALLDQLNDTLGLVATMRRAGLIAPLRPDKYLRMAAAMRRENVSAISGFASAAQRCPDRPGLVDELGTLTWRDIDQRCDAFAAAFDRQRLDDLLLKRKRELRALLEAHIVKGRRSLAALRDAGNVTTLAGDTLTVAPKGAMARFDNRATTVCADYDVANARIHVIDRVLG